MYLVEGPGLCLLPLLLIPFLIECAMLLYKSRNFVPVAGEIFDLKQKTKTLQRKIKGLSDIDDFVEKKKLERELLSTEKEFEEKKKYFDYRIAIYDAYCGKIKFMYSIGQFLLILIARPTLIQFEGFSTFPLGYWLSFPKFTPGLIGTMILTSCSRATANIIFPVKVTY